MRAQLCGMAAGRDEKGNFLEPVWLYTGETPETRKAEDSAAEDFAAFAARAIKTYLDGCRKPVD